jgi:putative tryptophan/tyrosine transport system substrate-binding protein
VKRREFIAGFGSAAVAPVVARAQKVTKPVIGVIATGEWAPYVAGFRKGLSEAGYVDGRNVATEYRWVEGHGERRAAFIAELIARKVDVLVALDGTATALAAKAATQTIPIVFRIGGDPVYAGLVPSLNRPGGNLTGTATLGNELGQKQLEMLRELVPAGAAIAVLLNPSNPNAGRAVEELQAAARQSNVRLLIFNIAGPSDLENAFASFGRSAIRGALATADPLFFALRSRLVELVTHASIPAIYSDRLVPEAGGLMSYGTNVPEGARQAGIYTGRILNGEKPADLPVQQSTKVELVINMKTARALKLDLPAKLLALADEVIE